ncbi:sialate O-acetylesterase [uncultured Sphingomonas sp.]|uniref:sialate O-acetylesterase n=1 Tax=uncultured Sphingomonas sp. TaxID=158754 RepID=UPI0025F364FB|nr:sialate O-acetylesterase [uncultured Sphingomonas sp.]
MKRPWLFGLCLAAAPIPAAAQEAPLLANVFTDHAVLQRDRPILLWGHAPPGETVAASFGSDSATAKADAKGRWELRLPARGAGGPYALTVRAGAKTQQLSDLMLGDVYLCGGQSNMEFPARLSTGAWGGLAHAPQPMLRFAHVEKASAPAPLEELGQPLRWRVIDGDSAGEASAVCFYMARALQQRLKIPVGFIDSDWGGTTIQSWISPESLGTLPNYAESLRSLAALATDAAAARTLEAARTERWWSANDPRWATTKAWSTAAFDDSGWPSLKLGGSWRDAGIPALESFDGVVWLRKVVTLTEAQAAAADRLQLGPIDSSDTVWINGRWTGANNIDWFWRDYAVPAGALHAGRNVIAIRILGGKGPTGAEANHLLKLHDGSAVPLDGLWSYQLAAPLKDKKPPIPPWEVPTSLSTLYNAMIAPIARYGFKAAAWYQGESNVAEASEYRALLALLFKDWRGHMGQPQLPMLVAQLASYGTPASMPGESDWALLRQAQSVAVAQDGHAGLAVTLDLGDRFDIHPTQKLLVGERLARAARAVVYGEAIAPGGPQAVGVTRQGNDLVVQFRHPDARLRTYSADSAIGFEACSAAQCRFVPGSVDGGRVVLRGAGTPDVTHVRYAWSDAPYVNLYSSDDLPAVPFDLPVSGLGPANGNP